MVCNMILEPVRRYFDVPLIIKSGKRSEELNKKIHGYRDSDNLTSNAWDFCINYKNTGPSIVDIYKWIVKQDLCYRS